MGIILKLQTQYSHCLDVPYRHFIDALAKDYGPQKDDIYLRFPGRIFHLGDLFYEEHTQFRHLYFTVLINFSFFREIGYITYGEWQFYKDDLVWVDNVDGKIIKFLRI